MSKKFNNCAQLCASLILGFTFTAFAAEPNAILMNIPPPPSLQNPISESKPAVAYGSTNNLSATVGTNKKTSPNSAIPTATALKVTNAKTNFSIKKENGKNTARATASQNDNTDDVDAAIHAATHEATPKSNLQSTALATTTWSFQQLPAENTMYTMPSRK